MHTHVFACMDVTERRSARTSKCWRW